MAIRTQEQIKDEVALAARRSMCCATEEEIAAIDEPVAELIVIRVTGKGRTEEFASLPGYRPPEGVVVLSRQPLYLRP